MSSRIVVACYSLFIQNSLLSFLAPSQKKLSKNIGIVTYMLFCTHKSVVSLERFCKILYNQKSRNVQKTNCENGALLVPPTLGEKCVLGSGKIYSIIIVILCRMQKKIFFYEIFFNYRLYNRS